MKWLLTIAAAVAGVVVAKKWLTPAPAPLPSANGQTKVPTSPAPGAFSPLFPVPGSPSLSTAATTKMRVVAPSGLRIRSAPVVAPDNILDTVPFGHEVEVKALRPDGWAEIGSLTTDHVAFVCNTCSEAPGGPWLAPLAEVAA